MKLKFSTGKSAMSGIISSQKKAGGCGRTNLEKKVWHLQVFHLSSPKGKQSD
jgi:hypothetical protein